MLEFLLVLTEEATASTFLSFLTLNYAMSKLRCLPGILSESSVQICNHSLTKYLRWRLLWLIIVWNSFARKSRKTRGQLYWAIEVFPENEINVNILEAANTSETLTLAMVKQYNKTLNVKTSFVIDSRRCLRSRCTMRKRPSCVFSWRIFSRS